MYSSQGNENALCDPPAGFACRNRIIEWACAMMMLNFGFTCMLWPETIINGHFRYLLATGVTPTIFIWTCLTIGTVRTFALIFNGRGLPWSARIRAITAILGGVVFGILAWCLAYLSKDTTTPSLSVGVYLILAGLEVYTTLRAGADVNEKPYKEERALVARIITNDTTHGATGLSSVRSPDSPQS